MNSFRPLRFGSANGRQIYESNCIHNCICLFIDRTPTPFYSEHWCVSNGWHGSCASWWPSEPQTQRHLVSLVPHRFIIFENSCVIICKSDYETGVWFSSRCSRLISLHETQRVLEGQSSINYHCWHLQICANIKGDFWGLFSVVEVTCFFTLEAGMQK